MTDLPPIGTEPTRAELAAMRAWIKSRSIPGAARALDRSPYTVRQQLRNVRSRLGARDLAAAAEIVLDRYPPG